MHIIIYHYIRLAITELYIYINNVYMFMHISLCGIYIYTNSNIMLYSFTNIIQSLMFNYFVDNFMNIMK